MGLPRSSHDCDCAIGAYWTGRERLGKHDCWRAHWYHSAPDNGTGRFSKWQYNDRCCEALGRIITALPAYPT